MSRTIGLGRAHFHTAESPLQLQLTATGHFIWPIDSSFNSFGIEDMQGTQLFVTWVTEAPEIELRLHIEIDPDQELIVSRLVSTLGEKICGSKVWSDLGFTIVFKSCETSESGNDTIPKSCLIFGMSKDIRSEYLGKIVNRRVPTVLRDSPSAHPPVCHPWMLLAAIDINLHYYNPLLHAKTKEYEILQSREADLFIQQSQFWGFDLDPERRDVEYLCSAGTAIPVVEIYISDDEMEISSEKQDFDNPSSHSSNYPSRNCDGLYDANLLRSLQIQYQLLDEGLRSLIMSPPSKVSPAKLTQEAYLTRMTDLAPAVFMPQYRQAMDQRAVSIPIITKAIASMVEGSQSLELKRMAESFLQRSTLNDSVSVASTTASTSMINSEGLQHSIQLSLWRTAQTQLRKMKHPKNSVSFFDNGQSETFKTEADVEFNLLLESETHSNHELLDCDSYLAIDYSTYDFPNAGDCPFEWMDEDSDDEHSERSVFECISVSDPLTSMESLFSSYSTASSYSPEISDMLICEEDVESFSLKDGSDLLCEF